MKKNFFRICTLTLCFAIFFCTSVAFAASTTLMSYNGIGIRDKDSVEKFTLGKSTTIHLEHETTAVEYNGPNEDSACELKVSLMKKNTLSYTETGDEIKTTGIQSKTATWTKAAGTYRLHFATKMKTETWWPGATINGRIYK